MSGYNYCTLELHVKRCFLAIAMLLAMPCSSKDISILVDVSGSMSRYGPWQDDALSLVKDVLAGREYVSDAWRLIGRSSAVSDFSLSSGDQLHVIPFGNVSSSTFPYFRALDLKALQDLDGAFPRAQTLFREARTNKPLAVAVGARLAARNGGIAQLIMISDFLNDSDLNSSEQDFFNEFDSEAEQSAPVTLSWNRDSRLQVKLMQVRLPVSSSAGTGARQTPVPPPRAASLQLFTPQPLAGQRKAMRFRWKLSDPTGLAGYTLDILDERSRKSIVHRAGLIAPAFTWADAPGGRYRWRVAATFEDQSQVTSPLVPFSVSGRPVPVLLLVLLGVVAAAWYGAKRWTAYKEAKEASQSKAQERV